MPDIRIEDISESDSDTHYVLDIDLTAEEIEDLAHGNGWIAEFNEPVEMPTLSGYSIDNKDVAFDMAHYFPEYRQDSDYTKITLFQFDMRSWFVAFILVLLWLIATYIIGFWVI